MYINNVTCLVMFHFVTISDLKTWTKSSTTLIDLHSTFINLNNFPTSLSLLLDLLLQMVDFSLVKQVHFLLGREHVVIRKNKVIVLDFFLNKPGYQPGNVQIFELGLVK